MKRLVTSLCCWVLASFAMAQNPGRIDSLKSIVEKQWMDSTHLKALHDLGIIYERIDMHKSSFYLKAAAVLAEQLQNDNLHARACIRLGGIYSSIADLDSAQICFDKAKEITDRNPENISIRYAYHTGLGIHYMRTGNNHDALYHHSLAAETEPDQVGPENIAGSYLNMANVYGQMGQNEKRQESVYKALKIFEQRQNKYGLAFCYNALGNIFYEQKIYEKAQQYYQNSYDIREKLGDKRGMATVLNNLANVHMDTDRLSEALAFQTRSMQINDSLNLKEEVAKNLINQGKIYQKKGALKEALDKFQEAYALLQKINIHSLDAFVLAEMGRVQSQLDEKDNAYKSLNLSIEEARKRSDPTSELNAHAFLKDLLLKEGKYKEAFEIQSREFALKDSLEGVNLKMKLQELETQYQVEIKENEIALLKAEKELDKAALFQEKANQRLYLSVFFALFIIAAILINRYRVLNETKRQLEVEILRNNIARDLHDDLGSTLSSIHIISKMAMLKENGKAGQDFSKISHHAAGMMDKLGDIVWSIHPNNDHLDQLIIKMREFAVEILEPKGITIDFQCDADVEKLKIHLEKRKNIFLIFKESINNIAKYSECQHVMIALHCKEGQLNMIIKDDGVGFDVTKNGKGNGLRNMRERARHIGGEVLIESLQQSGSSVQLTTPIT
ncbi:MAG: tetratricopeptide repeat protein [Cyclobacteriaceae bacterium]|nr:tetratricopeptide repeat protein [Cyclobacteriaceae bacterium]